ncbi:oxidoreductase [Fusarium sp. NRRL 52700]|nr:oxidoreductase [Fusarium sp. NRRL 52700]
MAVEIYTAERLEEDILIRMAGQAMDDVAAAGVPGAFLVDILPLYKPPQTQPLLVKITDAPNAIRTRLGSRRELQENYQEKWSAGLVDLTAKLYAFVKHQHALGKKDNSFALRLLEVADSAEEVRFTIKWSALPLYTARADTKKAQEEIDGVIGNERLPDCSDRPSLPYVNAIVKEVLRWHAIGYFIPKDARIMPNIWYFAHDPEVHHEPMYFELERFLSTNGSQPEQDPRTYTFDYGRRVCSERVLADNALFRNIAQSLAVLHIRIDENGAQPDLLFSPGMIIRQNRHATSI